jgi:hypothetical protein
MQNVSYKEWFFKHTLLPLGVLAELVARNTGYSMAEAGRLGASIWAPLHLATCYVLCDTKALHPDALKTLDKELKFLKDELIDILSKLRAPVQQKRTIARISAGFARSARAEMLSNFNERFATGAKRVLAVMDYPGTGHEAWIAAHMSREHPLYKAGKLDKWRTLARNMNPEAVMVGISRPDFAVLTRGLSSNTGPANAAKLWALCFQNNEARLPNGVRVETEATGLLCVIGKFEPKLHVKLVTSVEKALPTEFAERLATKTVRHEVSYRNVAAAVEETAAWVRSHELAMAQLSKDYETWAQAAVDKQKVDTLLARARKHFSEEDLTAMCRAVEAEHHRKSRQETSSKA